MAGQDTLILYSDYNTIQTKIESVLGTGSGNQGYGQSVSSSLVAQNAKISVTQWNNLRSDIIRCRQHQTGVAPSLTQPTTSVKIYESDRAAYLAEADLAFTNRLVAPPSGEATREYLSFGSIQRTSNWNGVRTQTVTITFTDANAARYFFNTGSRIEFSGSRTGGLGTAKDSSWTTLLSTMGTVYFNYDVTTSTGSGTGSNIGFYDLTTSSQKIFQKDTTSPTYTPNSYQIWASAPSSTTIQFIIYFRDDSAPGGWGVDEDVTGTLTSDVKVYRASGSNVSVNLPAATSSGIV